MNNCPACHGAQDKKCKDCKEEGSRSIEEAAEYCAQCQETPGEACEGCSTFAPLFRLLSLKQIDAVADQLRHMQIRKKPTNTHTKAVERDWKHTAAHIVNNFSYPDPVPTMNANRLHPYTYANYINESDHIPSIIYHESTQTNPTAQNDNTTANSTTTTTKTTTTANTSKITSTATTTATTTTNNTNNTHNTPPVPRPHQQPPADAIYASDLPYTPSVVQEGELPELVHLAYWKSRQRRCYHYYASCKQYANKKRPASYITRIEAESMSELSACRHCVAHFGSKLAYPGMFT